MSFTAPSVIAGAGRAFEFGRTYVVKPKAKHQATVVWLHGLGDNGASWSQLLETLPLPNIEWICPTAPTQPVTLFGGFPSTAWFDVGELSENAFDDLEGLDASAAHVANLLSTEPADVKLGVGGFSMGAATSLYSSVCYASGKYGNGKPYHPNLSAVLGLSGWLPCSKTLGNKMEGVSGAARRAASLPVMIYFTVPLENESSNCPSEFIGDDVVPYRWGKKSSQVLISNGFQDMSFKDYDELGHSTIPDEMEDICAWITSKLELDGSSS